MAAARQRVSRTSHMARKADRPIHQLFVMVVEKRPDNDYTDNERRSMMFTRQVLLYVNKRIPAFEAMGFAVKANKITDKDLRNIRLRQAMKQKGIASLPALLTLTNIYLGPTEIIDLYNRNIKEFAAHKRRDETLPGGMTPEDALHDYYDNVFGETAWDDAMNGGGDGGLGDGDDDMMEAYRRAMGRREGRASNKSTELPAYLRDFDEGGSGGGGGAPSADRGDNLYDDDDVFGAVDGLIDNINTNSYQTAFSGGGGDSLDDDGGPGSAQDSLMEAAFWGNQEMTNF